MTTYSKSSSEQVSIFLQDDVNYKAPTEHCWIIILLIMVIAEVVKSNARNTYGKIYLL